VAAGKKADRRQWPRPEGLDFARSIHSNPNSKQLLRHLSGQDGFVLCKPAREMTAYGQDVKILNACKEMDVPMFKMDVPMFTPLPMLAVEKVKLH
jgi:hypothetical protein